MLLLLAHYVVQLPSRWPNWSSVSAGGAAPPASLGRWPEKAFPKRRHRHLQQGIAGETSDRCPTV